MLPRSFLQRKLQSLLRRIRLCMTGGTLRYIKSAKGVIHVGANTGQERYVYEKFGLDVVWIEAAPDLFAALQSNIRDLPHQKAIECLVSDKNGAEHVFHIASNNGASSSILELKEHSHLWPGVHYTKDIKLLSKTLSTLITENQLNLQNYDMLVIDTQGSELLVLQGALPLLRNFKFIVTEAADFEAYKGCCKATDLIALLQHHGFHEVYRDRFATLENGRGSYYELVFERRSIC
jgi:FkbM family methyltransferase